MLKARGLDQGSYLILQSKYLRARASELEQIQVSAEQARAAGSIKEKPLIVLTAALNSDAVLQSGLTQGEFDEFQRIWVDDLQMRLAHLSTRGKRILVSGSSHDIPTDRPDSIVSALRDIRATQ